MGFYKVGSKVQIVKVGKTLSELGFSAEQTSGLNARLAVADFVNLNPGKFIYTRERAVSAYERYGLNGNADGFMDSELRARYASFINVPRYIDHANTDTSRAVGIVLNAWYHPLAHPKGGWVETVSALDRAKMSQVIIHTLPDSPTLLDAILSNRITDVSMGCYVEESVCTVCGNRAATEHEYCDHVTAHRGRRVKAASTCPVHPDKDGFIIAGELNFGANFFDLSTITTLADFGGGGADEDAKILEKVAKACTGWECYIIDRLPRQLMVRPYTGANEGCDSCPTLAADIRPNQEDKMLNKKGQEAAPIAPPDAQSVTDRIRPATDPKDEDKTLFDQSKGKSDTTTETSTAPPDNVGQEGKAQDYPLTGSKIATEADPANKLGGEPEQVADEREKIRKDKFEGVKNELGDKADAVEDNMEDEIEETKPLSEALGILFAKRFPVIANSERFREIQDELDILETRRSSILSALRRTRSANRKNALKNDLKQVNASIVKYFGQFAGNPQDMTDAGDYALGNPDKNLADQAKGTSESPAKQTVAPSENITQEKTPKDYPRTGSRKIIASTEADKAANEMLELVWHQGKSFEEAQQIVLDRYGRDVTAKCEDGKGYDSEAQQGFMHAKHPEIAEEMDKKTDFENLPEKKSGGKDEEPPEKFDEMKDKAEKNEKDKEGRMKRKAEGEESVEVDEASRPSDISQNVGDDVEEIDKGNKTTLVSPETKKVAPSTEFIQARLNRERSALYRRVMGVDSKQDVEVSKGNGDTLTSPETKGVADKEVKIQDDELKRQMQGVSVPAITGSLSLALATLAQAQKEVAAQKEQNTRLYKRLAAVKANWKWEEVKKIAVSMLKKGFFLEAPDGSQRNWVQQKNTMIVEARRMMKKSNEELEEVKSLIARALVPGTPVKQWTKTYAMPREGTVRMTVAQRSSSNPDEIAIGENLFE